MAICRGASKDTIDKRARASGVPVSGRDRTESPQREGLVRGRTWSDSPATAQIIIPSLEKAVR